MMINNTCRISCQRRRKAVKTLVNRYFKQDISFMGGMQAMKKIVLKSTIMAPLETVWQISSLDGDAQGRER